MNKKFWMFLFCFLLSLTGCQAKQSSANKASEKKSEEAIYWIMTDPHSLSPSLYDNGEAFQFIEKTAAGKDLRYTEEGLKAFVDKALKEKPTGVIVTGDLTLNGEKASLDGIKKIFQPLVDAHVEVYMMPGNHDIFDGWARKYKGKDQVKTEEISPNDFKKAFAEMGFQKEHEQAPDSLSYKVSVNDNLDFYFLDTNKYGQTVSSYEPVTSGKLRTETWEWLEQELKESGKEGHRTMVFMHHNLYQHNALVHDGYVIDDAEHVADFFHKYGVTAVFSGHIHAQDAMVEQVDGVDLPEIVTSSYAISPKAYGKLTISNDNWHYQQETINVEAWAKAQKSTDENLLNYNEYLENIFMKDGRQMAYQRLFDAGLPDDSATDEAAELMGQLNLAYFSGRDNRTNEEAEKIRASAAYQLMKQNAPFLSDYIDTILQDDNANDIDYQGKWIAN